MAQRVEPKDSADDFPTPPWATRALLEHAAPVLHEADDRQRANPGRFDDSRIPAMTTDMAWIIRDAMHAAHPMNAVLMLIVLAGWLKGRWR
jgi:hypothetical protein